MTLRYTLLFLLTVMPAGAFLPDFVAPVHAQAISNGPVTGFPVPRFVSFKSDRVNVRRGPGADYPLAWIYRRAGLPVEITAEFENWRRIRDWEGAEGWVFYSLLSGRRTVMVTRADADTELSPLYARTSTESALIARLQPGVIASVNQCTGSWCAVEGPQFSGYVEQDRLWGVYPGERFE